MCFRVPENLGLCTASTRGRVFPEGALFFWKEPNTPLADREAHALLSHKAREQNLYRVLQ